MRKAIFSGSLSIGLINIPIKLYKATEDNTISFNNLCDVCGGRIKMKRWCDNCQKEVEFGSMKKGYSLSKSQIVVVEKDDIDRLKLKSEKVLEIKGFLSIANIDSIYFSNTKYYVIPQNSDKAYNLLERVLSLKGLIGVGKITLRNKEQLVGVRSYKGYLLIVGLHYFNEVLGIPSDLYEKTEARVDENQLNLALKLFENMGIEFESLSGEKDRYSESLKELVKAKAENKEFSLVEEIAKPQAKDLNELLEESLKVEIPKKKKIEVSA
jgi:DNA end-binding protein Ku